MTEALKGVGKVFKQRKFVADVEYDLRIAPKYRETRTLTGEGRLSDFSEVRLQINPASAIAEYCGDRLTLHMSDGRKQDFIVNSSQGNCTATGGPHQ